ncbi:histone acetyltransferase [Perilla frutescens var. hirtella]|uniref:Histone acetyltransferase n=1 Tax=Perilla frutescens var. hirtella TaxID=608512 RepID=A0AAD4P3H8_PERFH|nr:histone acetyltransferase [Perilla frutescens var. hirtella]KAH6825563.1 histone acetyltransferase [Perilla frutescens var. hirtella]
MASTDQSPGAMPPGDGAVPPGKAMTVGHKMLDKGAQMMQSSFKPIKKMSQHVCSFAIYSHDFTRQIETHHYITRLNQDFLQCAVYDSDDSTARLIGVEYIVSQRVFDSLQPEEQKLWHSHFYEITSGTWVNPKVPEMIQRSELEELGTTYGKFWCTWQVDRGDRLPLGAPALMVSPQGVNMAMVKEELIKRRDEKYKLSSEELRKKRAGFAVPVAVNPYSDYWMQTGKGFAIDVDQTQMKTRVPFP